MATRAPCRMVSCLPLPRHAEAPPQPPATAAACLRPHSRLRLSFSSRRAAAKALAAATPDAASGLTTFRHASVANPYPLASTPRQDGGGIVALTVAASAVAISAGFIFFSVIRSLLECKRTAESLEKSFESTRKKLPQIMSSVRLVGREVSELAIDLSDLSQDMKKGVRSSMSIVHTAEAQLHQLTPSASQGTTQSAAEGKMGIGEPLLASTVRELRELIGGIRSGFGAAFGIAGLFIWASNLGPKQPKNRS